MNHDKHAGEIVVFRFPQTDLDKGKLRSALLLARLLCEYDDWLPLSSKNNISKLYIWLI